MELCVCVWGGGGVSPNGTDDIPHETKHPPQCSGYLTRYWKHIIRSENVSFGRVNKY